MAYTITDTTNELSGLLHGTSPDKITNLYGVYNRAGRQVLLDVDPQETIRIVEFANPIYNQIYDYACPADLKGNKIIDIRPQVNRTGIDRWLQQYNQDFDLWKSTSLQDSFTTQFNTGVKTLRINAPWLPAPIVINTATMVGGNGTWVAGGGASNVRTDNINFAAGSGSVAFDLDASGSGYIENSTMNAVDLTDHEDQAQEFFEQYLPDGSDFTTIQIRWGSSSGDYWQVNLTADFNANAWVDGWNTNGALWSAATSVGSPDASAVNYIRVTYTYTGAQTAVRINSFTSNLGSILEAEYYSKYIFRSSAGVFKEKVTADSDIVNLDTETYNLFLYQAALQAVQQLQDGGVATLDLTFFAQKYSDALERYKGMYLSQVQKPQASYYPVSNKSRSRWGSQNMNY